jgi:orotate phosphoribosyltransferase
MELHVMELGPGYLQVARQMSTAQLARVARRDLKDIRYDTMAGTGLSGALVIPRLAERLRKNWVIIRKGVSHTSMPAEGFLGRRWVFVDDQVSTGQTRQRVIAAIAALNWDSAYAGTWLYGELWHSDRGVVQR